MVVIIKNISETPIDGEYHYCVQINDETPIAVFNHRRDSGLVECLKAAANAVQEMQNKEKWKGDDKNNRPAHR